MDWVSPQHESVVHERLVVRVQHHGIWGHWAQLVYAVHLGLHGGVLRVGPDHGVGVVVRRLRVVVSEGGVLAALLVEARRFNVQAAGSLSDLLLALDVLLAAHQWVVFCAGHSG